MTPIEIACRHVDPDGTNCGAEALEPCRFTPARPPDFHAERIEDAAALSSAATPVDAAAFDAAVAKRLF